MENKLKRLFDYQKFAGNPRLAAMLADADSRYGSALSDDDLELVSAAGDVSTALTALEARDDTLLNSIIVDPRIPRRDIP